MLRELLLPILQSEAKQGMLKENGGKYCYSEGWANRFFKRHKLPLRIASTKMRELPADFEQKKAHYVEVAADIIARHDIPAELIIGIDETGCNFVNRARGTRSKKGAKKVRLLGVGDEKA